MSRKPTKHDPDELDDEVRTLLSELCSAINVSLRSSGRINAVLEKLSEKQYESALYLDAMVYLNPKNSKTQPARALPRHKIRTLKLKLDRDDERLLKSLKITVKPDSLA